MKKLRAKRISDRVAAFWAKVQKSSGCWLWTASVFEAGYGAFRFNGRTDYAHRYSWILQHGTIPSHLFVCHTCDVRHCVNPKHLFLGTQKDNLADMNAKGRGTRGERHGNLKLTWKKVQRIRSLYAKGNVSQSELGNRFGVTRSAIAGIVRNELWVI